MGSESYRLHNNTQTYPEWQGVLVIRITVEEFVKWLGVDVLTIRLLPSGLDNLEPAKKCSSSLTRHKLADTPPHTEGGIIYAP